MRSGIRRVPRQQAQTSGVAARLGGPDLAFRSRGPMRIGLRQNGFDLGSRHHREEPHEQAEHGEEEPEAADQAHDVPARGSEVTPRRGQEVTVQRRHDDDEALEPHADIDDDRESKEDRNARARPPGPEQLWADDVAGDHDPVGPGVRSNARFLNVKNS